ncbi:MAG: hypothetical protein NZ869_04855 [Thermoanaerobaculum sp.]|nr:hypothetical protein [Thermoanaerobaculum sp.]MDW7967074.1 beta-ketoacyl synthase N-terminal-like domain-containing protein [Thermoanaerobaculum sp.]
MRVGIHRAGVVCAAGSGLSALRQALADPLFAPTRTLPRPDAPPLPAATCPEGEGKGVLPPLVARRLDRASRLLAVAARQALAVEDPLPWPPEAVGVAMGTWTAGTSPLLDILQAVFTHGPEQAPPMHFPNSVANAPASQLGILHRLAGPNLTFFEKQAGGLRAVVEAWRILRAGKAQAMVVGGVDEAQWLNAEAFHRLRALARDQRPGFTLGEGAVAMLLAADAPVALLGAGGAGSPCPSHLYPPTPTGLVAACRRALDEAGLGPEEVELVVSLANGNPHLAQLEASALSELFPLHRPAILGSLSQRLGEGAFASALRLLVAAAMLQEPWPVTWPVASPLQALGFPPLAPSDRPRTALVTAVAGGGSCLAAVLGRVAP